VVVATVVVVVGCGGGGGAAAVVGGGGGVVVVGAVVGGAVVGVIVVGVVSSVVELCAPAASKPPIRSAPASITTGRNRRTGVVCTGARRTGRAVPGEHRRR
jgi:hypothetical protein